MTNRDKMKKIVAGYNALFQVTKSEKYCNLANYIIDKYSHLTRISKRDIEMQKSCLISNLKDNGDIGRMVVEFLNNNHFNSFFENIGIKNGELTK
jgi:regulatory protein YycH of two-component signal transduction system YycFG